MLRIAIGLDRSHRGVVDGIEVDVTPTTPTRLAIIEPVAGPGVDLTLEVFSAQERAHLLAEALDRTVEIRDGSTEVGDRDLIRSQVAGAAMTGSEPRVGVLGSSASR